MLSRSSSSSEPNTLNIQRGEAIDSKTTSHRKVKRERHTDGSDGTKTSYIVDLKM